MNLKLPTVDDIRAAFREGEEAVVALFLQQQEIVLTLVARLEQQSELIEQQNRRIQELEARLNKNSRTSSKPPSSDGYAKPKRTKSQRQPGQKPTGGQPGHEGRTLKQIEQADEVIEHRPASCQHCGTDLQAVVGEVAEKRQVLDLPALRLWSVEHRRMDIVCPCCNQPNRGVLPDKVKGPIQYGDGVKALATLLTCGHHLPVARTGEILSDLFGQRVSDSLILEAATEAGEAARPAVNAIREALIRSEILHVDESEHLIDIGLTDNPSAPPNPFGKRKPKQTPPRNLLDRLVI